MINQKSKIKNQNYISKFKIILHFTLSFYILIFTVCILLVPFTHALESTPSSDIKTKLEELKKEIASKAAKLKQEVNRKLLNKAYVGFIKTKSENSLTLAQATGAKLVNINQDTVFESKIKKGQKVTLKTLSEEDYIAALGDVDETGVLTAKKVNLLPIPKSEPKAYLWGQIVAISGEQKSSSSMLVTLKDKTLKNVAVSLPSGASLKLNYFIIATGKIGKNDIFEGDFVHKIEPTPSAQTGNKK